MNVYDRNGLPCHAADLTVEGLRRIVQWCDNQTESWWLPAPGEALSVKQILACYHAAQAADYAGMDEWASDDADAAVSAWNRIRVSR